ncbi:MAG: NAD-dependent epimerase/dehydratase family protein [Chloroflexota bacterium]
MTTLLTGGNGWVPSHVLRRLARRGERVISYDLMEPDRELREFLGDAIEHVVFERGDVTDGERLGQVAAEHSIDSIIHAAAITPRLEREMEEPARIIDVNLMSTVRCLELMRGSPAIRRMVYVSSCAAWGDGHDADVLDEESESRATGLYGVTKHTGERFCSRYKQLFDLDVVAMRPANVYGPMERETPGYSGATELREMLRILASGETLKINSLEGPYHDWTFVEDIAEGIERAWATPNLPHDVYSITCGRNYSIGEMLEAFKRAWPEIDYEVVPEAEANYLVSGEPEGPRPSNERLRADFGWTPSTSLDDGVQIYLDWIRQYGPQ